jgi:hypothetical protein
MLPNISPILVIMMVSICVLEITDSRFAAKFSTMTIAFTPLSSNWKSISRGVYIGLVFTMINPAFSAPKTAMGYWSKLGIIRAILSPGFNPRECKYAPNCVDNRSASA